MAQYWPTPQPSNKRTPNSTEAVLITGNVDYINIRVLVLSQLLSVTYRNYRMGCPNPHPSALTSAASRPAPLHSEEPPTLASAEISYRPNARKHKPVSISRDSPLSRRPTGTSRKCPSKITSDEDCKSKSTINTNEVSDRLVTLVRRYTNSQYVG